MGIGSRDRKRRVKILVGRYVANPLVRGLERIGIGSRMLVELETTGAKTGLTRRVPLTAAVDTEGMWLIAQHSRGSGWFPNIEAKSGVRVRIGERWRTGIARAVVARGFRALDTNPMTVRVDFAH